MFPSEREPDGARFAPHHFYQGLLAVAVLGAWIDSLWLLSVSVAGLFAFGTMWADHLYPHLAAVLSQFAALGAVVLGLGLPLAVDVRVAVVLGGLVALDDAVSHAHGVWTPLDAGWKAWLLPRLRGEGR